MPGPVIYLVRSWPRLSQTFVVNEVLALERRGVELAIFSLVHSGEDIVQPQVAEVRARVRYLHGHARSRRRHRLRAHVTLLAAAPLRYASTLALCLRRPGLAAGYGDCSAVRCFTGAVQVAAAIETMRARGDDPVHLHAHFAHDPALVGLLAARLTGVRFSFTGHARDLLQIPTASLAARAAAASTVVTCCRANADYVAGAVPASVCPPVLVIHHGVQLSRFRPAENEPSTAVPVVVSVGRLVAKKGYDDLLHALARLRDSGTPFACRIYGDGPLRGELEDLRDLLVLRPQVEFRGACDSDEVLAALRAAHAFALTSRVADDGDRDGIPNVLVEAMACGLPVVTTSAGGIPELVWDRVNGMLVAPGDVAAVAAALGELLADGPFRAHLGEAARRTVEAHYDVDAAAAALQAVFSRPAGSELERVG